jgi:hypothetical protein
VVWSFGFTPVLATYYIRSKIERQLGLSSSLFFSNYRKGDGNKVSWLPHSSIEFPTLFFQGSQVLQFLSTNGPLSVPDFIVLEHVHQE